MSLDLFHYHFIDNKAEQTLFLFHGTGGTEQDFLFLDELLKKKYNIVSLLGNVDEGGNARFFRRLSLGVFDLENIHQEVEKLKKFLESWAQTHKSKVQDFIFLGYSNGANMILATLFNYPDLITMAVLLHPMLPFEVKKGSLDLSGHRLLVSIGENDQMILLEDSNKLVKTLENTQAQLTIKRYSSGHQITAKEMGDVVDFLK